MCGVVSIFSVSVCMLCVSIEFVSVYVYFVRLSVNVICRVEFRKRTGRKFLGKEIDR